MPDKSIPNSAPEEVAFCPLCGNSMVTQTRFDKPRRSCSECAYVHFTDPKVGVGVLVVKEKKVLLVRRAVDPERGKWSIPAGYLDRGEDPKATAVREAKEETGLDVVNIHHISMPVYSSAGMSDESCCMVLVEAAGTPSTHLNEEHEDTLRSR